MTARLSGVTTIASSMPANVVAMLQLSGLLTGSQIMYPLIEEPYAVSIAFSAPSGSVRVHERAETVTLEGTDCVSHQASSGLSVLRYRRLVPCNWLYAPTSVSSASWSSGEAIVPYSWTYVIVVGVEN